MTPSLPEVKNSEEKQNIESVSSSEELTPMAALSARRYDERAAEFKIKSGLKSLRITAAPEVDNTPLSQGLEGLSASRRAEAESDAGEEEPVLMLSPTNATHYVPTPASKGLQVGGVALSVFWLAVCGFYFIAQAVQGTLPSMAPHELGGVIAGALAPVALLWMIISTLQRRADVQNYAQALRGELQSLIFPTEERARVVHRDIEALCKQAADLSASSKAVIKSIQRARMGLRAEIRDFVGLSKKTEFHIDRLSETRPPVGNAERTRRALAGPDRGD